MKAEVKISMVEDSPYRIHWNSTATKGAVYLLIPFAKNLGRVAAINLTDCTISIYDEVAEKRVTTIDLPDGITPEACLFKVNLYRKYYLGRN